MQKLATLSKKEGWNWMCLNNFHVRIWRFIWAATCAKPWRNAKPLRYQLQDKFQTGLKNNITRVNHCLKYTIEDRAKGNTWISTSHFNANSMHFVQLPHIFFKEGRLVCSCSHCTISHMLTPRPALTRSDSLHNKHTTTGTKSVLYHKKLSSTKMH